jgi:type VI secretion system protein ImpL
MTLLETLERRWPAGLIRYVMAVIGTIRRGRKNPHRQPWYAVIGATGSGKTTALLNAGPQPDRITDAAFSGLHGGGGTKSWECWLAGKAVLIDIAGRVMQPDAASTRSQAGWPGLLKLLKNARPRQPLNGLIVTAALSDLAAASGHAGLDQAHMIRQRINELQAQFGLRIPIYLLFTKADLIAGFSEFFSDLDRAGRSRAWGMTFRPDAHPDTYIQRFGQRFDKLLRALETRLFRRLQKERKPERRALIAMFPGQMRSLKPLLTSFLQELLRATAGEPALFLHGVYFSSAAQNGAPIDRLAPPIGRVFGAELRPLPQSRGGGDRSYFLRRLLQELIPGEAGFAAVLPVVAHRRQLLRAAGLATAVLSLIVGTTALWHTRTAEIQAIKTSKAAVQAYAQAATALPLDQVNSADLGQVVPLLDKAHATIPAGEADSAGTGLGLSQGPELRAAANELYADALRRILLPRLLWRLESQIRDNMNRPDFLYEATRIYLMLTGAGPPDRALVHGWMKLDWQAQYPNDPGGRFRDSLLRHLDALLAEPLAPVAPDDDLVA